MKTHIFAVLCLFLLMLFDAGFEIAKRAAQAESLAEKTANRFQVDKYAAWDFFSDAIPSASILGLVIECAPFLIAITLLVILKQKKVLYD